MNGGWERMAIEAIADAWVDFGGDENDFDRLRADLRERIAERAKEEEA